MTTSSSIFAWKIPWTEEPGGLQVTGLERVGHNWETEHTTHDLCVDDMILYRENPKVSTEYYQN